MPNWAWGTINVTGKKEDVLAFSKHFLCDVGDGNGHVDPGVSAFYRSFTWQSRDRFEEGVLASFKDVEDGKEATATILADFAWSAHSCLVDHGDDAHCISLVDACMIHQVDVSIQVQEPGMFFEEEITCDRLGNLTYHDADLRTGKCRHCGNTQGIASFEDPDDCECSECGETGFDIIEEGE